MLAAAATAKAAVRESLDSPAANQGTQSDAQIPHGNAPVAPRDVLEETLLAGLRAAAAPGNAALARVAELEARIAKLERGAAPPAAPAEQEQREQQPAANDATAAATVARPRDDDGATTLAPAAKRARTDSQESSEEEGEEAAPMAVMLAVTA